MAQTCTGFLIFVNQKKAIFIFSGVYRFIKKEKVMNEIKFTPMDSRPVNRTVTRSTGYETKSRSLERTPQQDRFERQRQRDKKNQIKGFMAGISAALMITGGGKAALDHISGPQENFDAQGKTVEQAADFCNVDPRAIILANSLESENETIEDIILPQKYDVLEEDIKDLEETIKKAPQSEKEALEEQLDELLARQELQNSLAEVYVVEGGKFAYIIPLEKGISAEEIKSAFGIEDGVLKKYNDLSYEWGIDTTVDVHQGYRDYTGASVPYEGIRVPVKELNQY